MKTTLLSSVLLLCFITNGIGQYKDVDRQTINESSVPSEVIRAQNMQFNDGFVIGWKLHVKNKLIQDDLTYYMANFKKNGRVGNYAYYSEIGTLLAYSVYVNSFDLPEGIQDYCNTHFQQKKIKSAELIDIENPKRFVYRVRLNNDGMLRYIYFDNNGNVIEKHKLPTEIFAFI